MSRGRKKGYKHSEETKRKIKLSNTGKVGNGRGRKSGHIVSADTRTRISEKAKKGSECNFWKGGIAPLNKIIRRSIEYSLWREAVFARDRWNCQVCGDNKSGNLQAHHIKLFSKYPELRFAIDNGITLCKKCHRKKHKKV